jgi:hypothetical protein
LKKSKVDEEEFFVSGRECRNALKCFKNCKILHFLKKYVSKCFKILQNFGTSWKTQNFQTIPNQNIQKNNYHLNFKEQT